MLVLDATMPLPSAAYIYVLLQVECVTFQENSLHDLEVNDAVASRMSLFYAHATPMLKVLSDTTSKFVSEVISQ